MLYIIKFIYGFLLPPGIFIILMGLLGIWLLRFKKRIGILLLTLTCLLYLFSIEATGDLLIHSLENDYQPPRMVTGDVIVVLGGGATSDVPDLDGRGQLTGGSANRILTAARLYHKTHLPIIVSGGEVFKDSGNEAEIAKRELAGLGVPGEKVILENKSLNTEQNAEFTKKILQREKFRHPVLVTSAFHMKRAVLNFAKQGIDVLPYPTDYRTSIKQDIYPNKFVPSDLENTRLALKEYLGILAL